MKLDEFAFVNQQLATILQDGIPIEGALRQLCSTMQRGALRTELQSLEGDLAKGVPLREALVARRLPSFYVQMMQVGVQSNDLPAMLSMLADYYQRANSVMTRLKGLMVYPVCVLVVASALSVFLTVAINLTLHGVLLELTEGNMPRGAMLMLWLPMILILLLTLFAVTALSVPSVRRTMRWRFPAFKEANLAQFALAMQLMLKNGVPLSDAINLMQRLEQNTPAGRELKQWQERLARGDGTFAAIACDGKVFPPLFRWLAAQGGEDLAAGFARAASLYQGRASFRVEMMLYAALPTAVLGLGLAICGQISPLMQGLLSVVRNLGAY